MSDSADILRSFNFCSDNHRVKFYHFETADGVIKCLSKVAKFGNLQALERYIAFGFLASIFLYTFLFPQSADQIGIATLHFYANPVGATIIQYLYLLSYFRFSDKSVPQQNEPIWNTQCKTTTNTGRFCNEMAQFFSIFVL